MKYSHLSALAAFALSAGPVFADGHAASGDAEAGEAAFSRQCVTCHVVVNEAGETLAGRKAKTGPNLYLAAGGAAGAVDGFRYGNGVMKFAEQGGAWTEENFVGYVQDPTKWLREATDDKKVRGKMTYKVRKEEDAINIYAYLASLAPES